MANNCFSYRFQHRKKCKVTIKISKDKLIKFKDKPYEEKSFTFSSKDKEHGFLEKESKEKKS